MDRAFWVSHALGIVLMLGFSSGCDQPQVPKQQQGLGSLPYLQQTHHPELCAELDRLIAEQATPELLEPSASQSHKSGASSNSVKSVDDELGEILAPQALRLTLQRVKRCYPQGKFQFDPVDLEKAREVLQQFSPQLRQYRAVLRRDGFQFHVCLLDGLLADLAALDHAEVAHRLEGLEAADLLATGKLEETLLPLRNMLLIDSRLSLVPHVTARLAAALRRREALDLVAAIVQHPRCTIDLQRELLAILESQFIDWSPDAKAWLGDRALGLHAYEMVRDGQLLSILTEQELQNLQQERRLNAFTKAVLTSLDEDEWFYLSTMRRLIDSCDEPYFERAAVLQGTNEELEKLSDTPRYPLFAATVLLGNVAAGQREQALDPRGARPGSSHSPWQPWAVSILCLSAR